MPLRRSCIFLPILKKGTRLFSTRTVSPVRGLRPVRALRCLTEKAPKPRSSTRAPEASAFGYFLENRVDDLFSVALVEMWIELGQAENQFRFCHDDGNPF